MTDRDQDKQLSRRDRRRAQKERDDELPEDESEETESPEADEADEADERADDQRQDSEDEDAEDEADADEARDPDDVVLDEKSAAATASKAKRKARGESGPSKTEKKRAKQEERSATASIRDRNKRLRDQAAQKRRGKRDRDRDSAVAQGLDASEMVDDVLARTTHQSVQFIRKHSSAIQWVVVLLIAGGIGWSVYSWRSKKTTAKTSDGLMVGVDAELATVVGETPADPEESKLNPRPNFASEAARLEAAQKGYAEAAKANPGSGAAILAEMGIAGVLYDEGKFDEAKAVYEKVRGSELAKHDADVRLRAVEGVGLCLEAKGDTDGAMKLFEELEKSDEPGFGALGMYHAARVLVSKGEKDKAKEKLTKVNETLGKERSPYQTGSYLERATRDLMAIVDPASAPVSTTNFTPDQLESLKEQIVKDPARLKQMLEDMGKMKAPTLPPLEAPPEPAPAPSGGAP